MDSSFAKSLDENIRKFRKIAVLHPRSNVLPVLKTESLQRQIMQAMEKEDIVRANRTFWMDQLVTFEAWQSIFVWRMSEQLESALILKVDNKLVACAAVCRAAFELSFTALTTSAKLSKVLNQLDSSQLRNSLCLSNTFPTDVELAIYGTRISERVGKGIPSQKNLLTSLDLLKRHPLGSEIADYYERLCDLTHPSWLGNRPFYRRGKEGTIVQCCQDYDPSWASEIQTTIDSTLSWTAYAARNVIFQSTEAVACAREAFEGV